MSFTYTGIDRGHSAPRSSRKPPVSALLKSKVGDGKKKELSGPRAMSPPQPGAPARRSPCGAAALPLGKLSGCAALRPGGAARLPPALPRGRRIRRLHSPEPCEGYGGVVSRTGAAPRPGGTKQRLSHAHTHTHTSSNSGGWGGAAPEPPP